jgi:hypothetical protein
MRRQHDLLNKETANRLNKRIYSHEASEERSIAWTKEQDSQRVQ